MMAGASTAGTSHIPYTQSWSTGGWMNANQA